MNGLGPSKPNRYIGIMENKTETTISGLGLGFKALDLRHKV